MRSLLRRLRGIAVTSLLWSMGWSIAGTVLIAGDVARRMLRAGTDLGVVIRWAPMVVPSAAVAAALYGLCAGAAFALFLTVAERRRRIADLSLTRVAAWGGLGGFLLPFARAAVGANGYSDGLPALAAITAVLGAGFAAGTLALARRADAPADQTGPTAGPGMLPPPNAFDAAPGDALPIREPVRG